jgi:hypothetical protein
VAEPAPTPVTTPVEISTVATEVLSEVQSPPVEPSEDNVVVRPGITDVVPEMVPAKGLSIVKLAVPEPVQPVELVTVTVYVVFTVAEVVGEELVASSKSVVGVQA